MAQVDTSNMRPDTRVELDAGEPFVITEYQHVKPGKGGAFVRLKLKSLISGSVLDRTLKAGESLPVADVTYTDMQYLYAEGEHRVCMDKKTYDQVAVPERYFFRGPVSWTIRTYSKFMHLPATYSSRGSHFTRPGGSMSDGTT